MIKEVLEKCLKQNNKITLFDYLIEMLPFLKNNAWVVLKAIIQNDFCLEVII
jgi:hypothetical protein